MPKLIADEQIYTAALQTVVERGYAGATTKQIAKAAAVSEVTLFRKYGNKAELIRQAITAMAAQLNAESMVQYTGDVRADLRRVVELYQGSAEKNGQFIYALLLEIPRYPELATAIDAPLGIFGALGALLARYQAEEILREEHPMHTLAGLLGPLITTNLIRITAKSVPFPPLDLEAHVDVFLNGRYR